MYLVAKPLIWSEAEGDLVVIETSIQLAFEKQQGLYHNMVTLCLIPVERLGNQAQLLNGLLKKFLSLRRKVPYTI